MGLTFCLCLTLTQVTAEDSPSTSTATLAPAVDDLSWLVGHWKGTGFGGICEEVWSVPSAGTMVGTFKMHVDDQVRFYEIMTITPDSAGPLLKVKHFNPDLTGWEEKDEWAEFKWLSSSEREIQFSGIVYERIAEDSLVISVTVKGSDGQERQEVIACRRVDD